MKIHNPKPFCFAAILLPALCFALQGADPAPSVPRQLAVEDSLLVSLTASVQAVDTATREVTLKGPLGNEVTFSVDKAVERLNEIKVGDQVQADYYLAIAAEVRPPLPNEEQGPIQLLEGAAKAPAGRPPGATGLRRFKVVATIEGLDRPTRTLTVKGPLGRLVTVRVRDSERLTTLRIGEPIVITYTEALAIALHKVK